MIGVLTTTMVSKKMKPDKERTFEGMTWGDNTHKCRGAWINSCCTIHKKSTKKKGNAPSCKKTNCVFLVIKVKCGAGRKTVLRYAVTFAKRKIKRKTECFAYYRVAYDGDKLTADAKKAERKDKGEDETESDEDDYNRDVEDDEEEDAEQDAEEEDAEEEDDEEEDAEEEDDEEDDAEEDDAEEEGSGDENSSSAEESSGDAKKTGDGKSSRDNQSSGDEEGGEGSSKRAPAARVWRGAMVRGGGGAGQWGGFRDNDEMEAERQRRIQHDAPEKMSNRRARTRGIFGLPRQPLHPRRGVMRRSAHVEEGASSSKADEDQVSAPDDEVPESQCDPNASHSRSGGSAW